MFSLVEMTSYRACGKDHLTVSCPAIYRGSEIADRQKGLWKNLDLDRFTFVFAASGIIDILYKPRLEKTLMSFIDKVATIIEKILRVLRVDFIAI
jgi:hypothetical protein